MAGAVWRRLEPACGGTARGHCAVGGQPYGCTPLALEMACASGEPGGLAGTALCCWYRTTSIKCQKKPRPTAILQGFLSAGSASLCLGAGTGNSVLYI